MFEKKPREAELDGLPEWVGKVTNGGEGAVAGGRVVPTGKEEEVGVRLVGEEEEGKPGVLLRPAASESGRKAAGGVRRLSLVSISSVDFFFPVTPNSSSLLRPEASESGRKAAGGVRRLSLVSISSVDFFFPVTPNSSSYCTPQKQGRELLFSSAMHAGSH
ncbi:hypothetical protein B296_00047035 [Ensete ventricosum]|uniref:Uncharacterized protein n=1 Tax=Ensete ventricosum TaxID=4639 RepID=A0A426YVF3_ENSVE|nr:hypothetical protein B296_00047035 [Ensete ventricosum]